MSTSVLRGPDEAALERVSLGQIELGGVDSCERVLAASQEHGVDHEAVLVDRDLQVRGDATHEGSSSVARLSTVRDTRARAPPTPFGSLPTDRAPVTALVSAPVEGHALGRRE